MQSVLDLDVCNNLYASSIVQEFVLLERTLKVLRDLEYERNSYPYPLGPNCCLYRNFSGLVWFAF